MPVLLNTLYFIIANLAGYMSVAVIANFAIQAGIFPEISDPAQMNAFKYWYFGGGTWAFIAGALVSLGWFFVKSKLRFALLLAPLYTPIIFSLVILARFQNIS